MQPTTYKALLLIADISGFTQFMNLHKRSFDNAKRVVVELLKSIIAASSAPLELAEVEGDAAFFYAVCRKDGDMTLDLIAIKRQVLGFFRSFYQTLHRLRASNECARGAQNLRLKVIIHAGEVAIEHIHGFDKLFGMDVILAHRLLKNSVPAREYVLMTESAHDWLVEFNQLEPERQTEYCEGIGSVDTVVFYPPAHLINAAWTPMANWRTSLEEESHSVVRPRLPGAGFSVVLVIDFGFYWATTACQHSDHRSARAQPVEVARA